MAVPTTFSDLNTSPAANSPQGSEAVFPDLDNHLRAIYAMLASVQANTGNGWVSPYATKAAPIVTGGMTVTGTVSATAFSGPLSGNASTATYATTAGSVTGGGGGGTAGTYTPTATTVENCSSASGNVCMWTRIGDTVTISGSIRLTVTTQAVRVRVGISLPVASNISAEEACAGSGAVFVTTLTTSITGGAFVLGDPANDRAEVKFHGIASGEVHAISFVATYPVA